MRIPLEDQAQDVIGKARRGLRLSEAQLVQKAGISFEQLESLQAGEVDAAALEQVAAVLDLDPVSLLILAEGKWHPGDVVPPSTFAAFTMPFEDMTVNAYLAWDREGGRAAVFDTGTDCTAVLEALQAYRLTADAIFLTHAHLDHIADLDDLVAETGEPVYISGAEKLAQTTPVADGQTFTVGGLTVTARSTPGHSPGGMTYVVGGLNPMLAVVGDALFASSMGGVAPELYPAALRANRENILALPGSTIICPGHGPLTTVEAEKKHNPFYAGSE
jgi:hydroxyacylglutathione hydrolase